MLVVLGAADWAEIRAAAVARFRKPPTQWTVFFLEELSHDNIARTLSRMDAVVRAERAGAHVLTGDFQSLLGLAGMPEGRPDHVLAIHDEGLLKRLRLKFSARRIRAAFEGSRVSTSQVRATPSLGLTVKPVGIRRILFELFGTAATVAAMAAVTYWINLWTDIASPPLTLMLAVVLSALFFGRWAGIIAASLASIALNFVFVSPVWAFEVTDPRSLVILLIFLGVGAVMSFLVARSADRAAVASDRQATASLLFSAARRMAEARSESDVGRAIDEEFGQRLDFRVHILRNAESAESVEAQLREIGVEYLPSDLTAAAFASRTSEPTGLGTALSEYVLNFYEPVATTSGNYVLAVSGGGEIQMKQSGFRVLVESLSDLVGLTLSRIDAHDSLQKVRLQSEAEHSWSILLAAMSHDFRTPLATILGSASSLQQFGDSYDKETSEELLGNIVSSAETMDLFVRRILDQTRLQAKMDLSSEDFVDMTDVVETALETVGQKIRNYRVETHAPDIVPFVKGDASLLEHLVQNLLENAMRYSKPRSLIAIEFAAEADALEVTVRDEGLGLSEEQCESIFEPFYRAHTGSERSQGIGLGLSICKEIARLHSAEFFVRSEGLGHGARFTIRLPIQNVVELDDNEAKRIA